MGLSHVRAALVVPDLTPRESKILVYLACCYSDTKHCWPALKTVAEETNILYKEVLRVINKLEKEGYIERFIEGSLKKIKLLGCYSDTNKVSNYYFKGVGLTPPIYKEVRKKRKKGESHEHGASTKTFQDKNPFLKESGKTNNNEYLDIDKNMKNPYMGKTIEEIANAQTPRHKLGDLKKVTPRAMETMWYELNAELYEDMFVSAFTIKEKGMLGHFIKKATVEYAEAAMFYALHNWSEFTNYCVSQGAKAHPSEPTVQYMLLYAQSAVNFAFKFIESKGVVLKDREDKEEAPPSKEMSRELAPENQPATHAEFKKIMGDDYG